MKKFVSCKVPDYMSTNVLKNNFLKCIFQGFLMLVFSEQLFFIFYFVFFNYFGQKDDNKKSYCIWFTFAFLKFCSIFVIITTQAHQLSTDNRTVEKYFLSR